MQELNEKDKMSNKLKLALGSVVGAVGTLGYTLFAHAQSAVTWTATDTDAVVTPTVSAFKTGLTWLLSNFVPFVIGLAVAIAAIVLLVGLIRRHKKVGKG